MFIRTKDKILEVTKDTKGTKFIVFGKTLLDYETFIKSEDDIINQSDTIEELVDELVDDTYKDFYKLKKENGITYVWSLKQRFRYWNDIKFDFIGTIYGSIYTSKGLIYVAKMNDKGELKLI